MTVSLIVGTAIAAYVLWSVASLFSNFKAAKGTRLPFIISPVNAQNPFWILACSTTPIVPVLKRLSRLGLLGRWTRCAYIGWSFDDKHALHAELGPVFAVVSPAAMEIWVGEPGAAGVVLSQMYDFVKPVDVYRGLEIFGPNLVTVEGQDWQRHRKLTAPSFNERTSGSVWDEACGQARDMLRSWTTRGADGTADTALDTATLALHVLTGAGFGVFYSYGRGVQETPAGAHHRTSYRDALLQVLRGVIPLLIFPRKWMAFPYAPLKLRELGRAVDEFHAYMEEMLADQRASIARQTHHPRRGPGSMPGPGNNLLSALVRASEEASKNPPSADDGGKGDDDDHLGDRQGRSKGKGRSGLTDDEVLGNLFIYNLAGYESTANSLAVALVQLAAHPEWQEWIGEEIRSVIPDGNDDDDDDDMDDNNTNATRRRYQDAFPRLPRCLAVMFEVLRLNGPNVYIPKATGPQHQTLLRVEGRDHPIPAHTYVNTNLQALHTDPASWGPDALVFRPSRWLRTPSDPTATADTAATATATANNGASGSSGVGVSSSNSSSSSSINLPPPAPPLVDPSPPGAFMPWAYGPRVCPGRKLAQVEFVAVLATLFRRHRVGPALQSGSGSGSRGLGGVGKRVTRQTRSGMGSRCELKWVGAKDKRGEEEGEQEGGGGEGEEEEARRRLKSVVEDMGISAITVQMRRPRDAVLVWRKVVKD